jgi:hypothetical protein
LTAFLRIPLEQEREVRGRPPPAERRSGGEGDKMPTEMPTVFTICTLYSEYELCPAVFARVQP